MRAFISLNLSEEKKREVFEIQKEVKNLLDAKTADSIKWEGKDKFHQTIFFLGDVQEKTIRDISDDLEKIEGKEISFNNARIGAFPNLRYPRVLMIELDNPDGNAFLLYNKICETITGYGFSPDKKFHPHITLGRVRRDRKINLVQLNEKLKIDLSFKISDFYIMESKLDSRGSVYKEIKKFKLV